MAYKNNLFLGACGNAQYTMFVEKYQPERWLQLSRSQCENEYVVRVSDVVFRLVICQPTGENPGLAKLKTLCTRRARSVNNPILDFNGSAYKAFRR